MNLLFCQNYNIGYYSINQLIQYKIIHPSDVHQDNSFQSRLSSSVQRDRPVSIEKFTSNLGKEITQNPVECSNLIQILEIISNEKNEIIKNALVKKENYITRFFYTENWSEWAENRSYLGRVVSLFKDYLCYHTASVKKRIQQLNPAIVEKANIESQEILKQLQYLHLKDFVKKSQEYELKNKKPQKSFIGKNCTSKMLIQYESKIKELTSKIDYFYTPLRLEALLKVVTSLKDPIKIDLYKSIDIDKIKEILDIASETFLGPSDCCLDLIKDNYSKEEIKILSELLDKKNDFDKFHAVFHSRRKVLSLISDIQSNIEQHNQEIYVDRKMANFFGKLFNSSDIITSAENEISNSSNIFSHEYSKIVKDAENNIIKKTKQIYKIQEALTITIPLMIQTKRDLLLIDSSIEQKIQNSIEKLKEEDWKQSQEKLRLKKSIQANQKIVYNYNKQLQIFRLKSNFFSDYLQSESIRENEISRYLQNSESLALQRLNESQQKIFQLEVQQQTAKKKLGLIQYT